VLLDASSLAIRRSLFDDVHERAFWAAAHGSASQRLMSTEVTIRMDGEHLRDVRCCPPGIRPDNGVAVLALGWHTGASPFFASYRRPDLACILLARYSIASVAVADMP
jgi:hypothetical protein